MINFDHSPAFEPFFSDTATVTGRRLEQGASVARDLKLSCKCCVLVGDGLEITERATAAGAALNVSIIIQKSDWPDHTPPQKGDVFTVEKYGSMHVIATPFQNLTSYRVECYFKRI